MATCSAGAVAADSLAARIAAGARLPVAAVAKNDDPAHEQARPEAGKPASKSDGRSDGKADQKSDGKTDGKGATKPADAKKQPVPVTWPAQEIELAKARCTQLLKTVTAVTTPEEPFRSGSCGAPAPVRLVSVGKNPAITFDPPALVTCDLVVGLEQWMRTSVQPAARKYLGAPIAKVETMSDYSCRNAYGRIANKLSEHGRANAVDIRGFITDKGEHAYVLEGWGKTKRDVLKDMYASRAAAAKAEAIKAEAERVEAERRALAEKVAAAKAKAAAAAAPPGETGQRTESGKGEAGKGETVVRKSASGSANPAHPSREEPSLGLAPTHLGGPRDKDKTKPSKRPGTAPADTAALPPIDPATVSAPAPTTKLSMFLHETHDAACRIFGTTLGPEANEAHRNHFHVDMAERKQSNICD